MKPCGHSVSISLNSVTWGREGERHDVPTYFIPGVVLWVFFQLSHSQSATHSNVTERLPAAWRCLLGSVCVFHLKLIITRQALGGAL